jgi:preprotein translocase subunit SecD
MSETILKKIFQPSKRARVWQVFAFIILLTFIGSLIDTPQYYNKAVDKIAEKTGNTINLPKTKEIAFRLGLDLQGGTHLVYKADMSEIETKDQSSALEGVRDVIERRVNVFGVSEPVVQTSISGGEHRVIVELAGVKDVDEAIDMIGETPLLEFKEESDEEKELSEEEQKIIDETNASAKQKAEEVQDKLQNDANFETLAQEYNQDQNTKSVNGDLGWVTKSTNSQAVSYIENLEVGDYTDGIIEIDNGYVFYKLEDKRVKTNPFNEAETEKEYKASHLLLCYDGIDGCETGLSKEDTYEKIKEIKAEATPENFADLVAEYTTEPGGTESKGSLGWFEASQMVEPFADAVAEQEVGTISYVVETKFGYHLIYKEDEKEIEEYKARVIFIPTVSASDLNQGEKNWKLTELTGKNLDRASVQFDPNDNSPQVSLEFDSEGADLFEEITDRNVGKQVAIFLDAYVISAPNVNEKITGGKAVISGNFNIQEAKLLAQRLNAGALPVPIEIINQQTVGATLGKTSLNSSLEAGLVGLALVAIFMVLLYRLSGVLAVFSLLIYGILVMAIFKIWPVTLTLSGLAGFILSVGMAVDANVLIFERLKEELRDGKPFDRAVNDSFLRAWPSIRDGNVSTLITCFILIQFTTSIVKGFAVTLALGVLISMFSAIIITKTFLQLIKGSWIENKLWLLGVRKK